MFSARGRNAAPSAWRAIGFAVLLFMPWLNAAGASASESSTYRWLLIRDRNDVFRFPVLPGWTVLRSRKMEQGRGVSVEFGRVANNGMPNTGAALFRFPRDGQYRTPAQFMALLASGGGCRQRWTAVQGGGDLRTDSPVILALACIDPDAGSFAWLWHAMLGSERDSLASLMVEIDLPPGADYSRGAVLGSESFLRALDLVKLFGRCGVETEIGPCPESIATVVLP
jgi:hypothetical protein